MTKLNKIAIYKIIIKFLRYSVVGVIGTGIHFGTLVFLVELFKINPIISSGIGFVLTVIASYFLNHYWTFKSTRKHLYSLPRYIIVSCAGLGLNTFIMYLMIDVLGLWYIWGQASVSVVIPLFNFVLNFTWTFSEHKAT
jgi:putative flippase GtrA